MLPRNIGALMSQAGSQSLLKSLHMAHTRPLSCFRARLQQEPEALPAASCLHYSLAPTNNQPPLTEQSHSIAGPA